MGQTIQLTRTLIGPLPPVVCQLDLFIRTVTSTNIAMIIFVNTVAKFTFICIFKSIPSIDDNFLAAYALISINVISILMATLRVYLPGRPTPAHVLLESKYSLITHFSNHSFSCSVQGLTIPIGHKSQQNSYQKDTSFLYVW